MAVAGTAGVPWRRVLPAGDSALLLEFGDAIDEGTSDGVQRLAARLQGKALSGVHGAIPGFATLLVEYDPMAWEADRLVSALRSLAAHPAPPPARRRHLIPVLYGGLHGEDLGEVAAALGMEQAEVVRLHAERDYRIYCLGFSPGFPLCGALPPELRLPRRATPRTRVPAGSVAIAGQQTGVYPLETAGGWHLIGRTPVPLFRWDGEEPVPYRPGDLLRFRPIGEEEFAALEEQARRGEAAVESVALAGPGGVIDC